MDQVPKGVRETWRKKNIEKLFFINIGDTID